uniref:Cell differentiation protein rcd1 n=1 Tax=Leersia perrieri TaxID=77586 RepID=A0A0D9VF29_9ORYZ
MLNHEVPNPRDPELVERLILDLLDPELKGHALSELRKKREMFQDLALLLWNSFGTIASLLQEIIVLYPSLSPPTLSLVASNRVCNALALLQCVALHPETRSHFIEARIPLYLCAFLKTDSRTKQFEYLRLTSLGIIGALVKVATFIIERIVVDDAGLIYICTNADRFYAVAAALATVVTSLVDQPSKRLVKHVIRCYLRMSENPRGFAALLTCLPSKMNDGTFNSCLRDDPSGRHMLQQLVAKVTGGRKGGPSHNSPGRLPWG